MVQVYLRLAPTLVQVQPSINVHHQQALLAVELFRSSKTAHAFDHEEITNTNLDKVLT